MRERKEKGGERKEKEKKRMGDGDGEPYTKRMCFLLHTVKGRYVECMRACVWRTALILWRMDRKGKERGSMTCFFPRGPHLLGKHECVQEMRCIGLRKIRWCPGPVISLLVVNVHGGYASSNCMQIPHHQDVGQGELDACTSLHVKGGVG